MHPILRALLLAFLPVALATATASPAAPLPDDVTLRRAIVGIWCREQNAGIASGTTYSVYREDGTAFQIIRAKIVFKSTMWIWIRQTWKIESGVLSVKSEQTASNSDESQTDIGITNYDLVSLDARQMKFRSKSKERVADKVATLPEEFRKVADTLAKK